MKKFGILLMLVIALTSGSYAQDTTTTPTPPTTTTSDNPNELTGFMLGAQIGDFLSETEVGIGLRYWHRYVGADLSFNFEQASADSGGTDVLDLTSFDFGAGLLLGVTHGRAKPHLRVGFQYSTLDDDVSGADISTFTIAPSISCDFRAADHLMFGVDIMSFPIIIDGDAGGADFDGFGFSFFNAVRIAYIF